MTYYRGRHVLISEYRMKGNFISTVDEILDLGVVFDPKLSFCNHLNFIIPKAYSLSAFIRRNLGNNFDYFTKKVLYCSFVRSRLEYASLIWSPNANIHIARIEKVQTKFLKFALPFFNRSYNSPTSNIPTFSYPSYDNKCDFLSLKTLEARRKISSLIFLHTR